MAQETENQTIKTGQVSRLSCSFSLEALEATEIN